MGDSLQERRLQVKSPWLPSQRGGLQELRVEGEEGGPGRAQVSHCAAGEGVGGLAGSAMSGEVLKLVDALQEGPRHPKTGDAVWELVWDS